MEHDRSFIVTSYYPLVFTTAFVYAYFYGSPFWNWKILPRMLMKFWAIENLIWRFIFDVYFCKWSFGKFENFVKFWVIENLIYLGILGFVKKRRILDFLKWKYTICIFINDHLPSLRILWNFERLKIWFGHLSWNFGTRKDRKETKNGILTIW